MSLLVFYGYCGFSKVGLPQVQQSMPYKFISSAATLCSHVCICRRGTNTWFTLYIYQEQQFGGEDFKKVKSALASTHAVYLSLQELFVNFGNIILPEAVKNIQLGEPSVLATLSALDQLITSVPQPMQNIQNQMQRLLTNAMFGIEVIYLPIQNTCDIQPWNFMFSILPVNQQF